MLNKEFKPPIKPKAKDQGDTKNIENVYLKEELRNTPPENNNNLMLETLNGMNLKGFTYNEDSELAKAIMEPEFNIVRHASIYEEY